MDLQFRRVTDDDIDLLHRWLNESGVVRWWEGDDVSRSAVERDYGPASSDPTEHWLALDGEHPIGWIQCYGIADELESEEVAEWLRLGVERSAAGIDYLIGAAAERGRGLGSAMIEAFVEQVVFGLHPGWTRVCASPYRANVGSWRALEKAGFERVGEFDDEDGPCVLMCLSRRSEQQVGGEPAGDGQDHGAGGHLGAAAHAPKPPSDAEA